MQLQAKMAQGVSWKKQEIQKRLAVAESPHLGKLYPAECSLVLGSGYHGTMTLACIQRRCCSPDKVVSFREDLTSSSLDCIPTEPWNEQAVDWSCIFWASSTEHPTHQLLRSEMTILYLFCLYSLLMFQQWGKLAKWTSGWNQFCSSDLLQTPHSL